MRALRGIMIVMVFVVAATLFAYLAFVHPIGNQFVRGKVAQVVAQTRKIVKEPVREAAVKPQKTEAHTGPPETQPPTGTRAVAKASIAQPTTGNGDAAAGSVSSAVEVRTKKATRHDRIDNPFKLEKSEFSRADIDAIIEQRRRIKEKLGEL